ncbi:NTP/NDP exchange transporter [Marinobacter sp. 2_MG-2023]|uniref:NTP/NDP exchange transporter n=1 Tax=Marinobacter sp. 2_MG-2023 TaxID=3062679 RepID=UPI0026E4021D|nr:MFS transporter [Marinobacter sp. 2_MG-2023]MDO6442902.1 MFS transporter [Marinobacter sp. 2_MG-2023]
MRHPFQNAFNLHRHEVLPVFVAVLYFFCVLTALMVLRPAREALGIQGGIDTVRWLFIGTAVVTLAVNPVFGWLVSKLPRRLFISATYLFFSASLLVFYGLMTLTPNVIGVTTGQVFYVWFSVFNLFVTMVFWALMADRFSLEQGKRFFGLIAVGGTLGAIFGPWLAGRLAQPLGTPALLLVATGFLVLALVAALVLTRLQPHSPSQRQSPEDPLPVDEHARIGGSAWEGLRAVCRSRYLMGIAAYVVILAVMATFIYFTRLHMVAAMGESTDLRTTLFARIDLITQIATLVMQALVAGHLMKRLGVSVTLALLPLTAALGFVGLAMVGSFAALVVFEATFRAVQRSLMRPARETLYTVASREEKYKAKAFIDTFVYRSGDVVGAQTEGLLTRLGMGLAGIAAVAVPLALMWAVLAFWLGRSQKQKALAYELAGAEQERRMPS